LCWAINLANLDTSYTGNYNYKILERTKSFADDLNIELGQIAGEVAKTQAQGVPA